MRSNFTILFSLQVQHTYFIKGICNCLQFTPAGNTNNILNRFGCIVKQQPGGFALYANTSSDITHWLAYIQQVTGENAFEFNITTTDPAFALFTELPVNIITYLLYNSNNLNNIVVNGAVQLAAMLSASTNAAHVGSITICFADIIKALGEKTPANFSIVYNARRR